MSRLLMALTIFFGIMGSSTVLAQANPETANRLMPSCRAFAANSQSGDSFLKGVCSGRVAAIFDVSNALGICAPNGVSGGQAVSVVVQYLEQNPARWHEHFTLLVIDAMKNAWPCQRRR